MFSKNPYLRQLAIVGYITGAIGIVLFFVGVASSSSYGGGAGPMAFGLVMIGVAILAWFLNLVASAIVWRDDS